MPRLARTTIERRQSLTYKFAPVEFTESELLRLSIGSRGRTQRTEPRLLVVARLLTFPLVL